LAPSDIRAPERICVLLVLCAKRENQQTWTFQFGKQIWRARSFRAELAAGFHVRIVGYSDSSDWSEE